MANLNKVMLIGRLTRDPESIQTRTNPQAGAKFGFAVNNRKLNQDTQQWEDVPVFIDVEIWNRGETNQQATRLFQTVRKGHQLFIEGHLRMDNWTDPPDKGGAKRSKIVVVVDNFQYLERREDGAEGGGTTMRAAPRPAAAPRPGPAAPRNAGGYDEYDDAPSHTGAPPSRSGPGGGGHGDEDEIPF